MPPPPRHLLLVGGTRAIREARAADEQDRARAAAVLAVRAATLPFVRAAASELPAATPRLLCVDDLEQAFPNLQTSGTRLVLTQSTYLLQRWLDHLDPADRIVATADLAALEQAAPEAFQRRGPWRHFQLVHLGNELEDNMDAARARDAPSGGRAGIAPTSVELTLANAYRSPSADERLRLCLGAVESAPNSAVVALACASACRELQDMDGARQALDRAAVLAPDWEAVHFEDGKFWLGAEDLERARAAFERAGNLMPTFSAAYSNLGATLGELNRPEAALAAFQQALASDPDGFTILNNIGVVTRELGRFEESESALRRVNALAPGFVFGHYNLGHTLLLAGRHEASVAAYEEGQRRDPQKNRRQACRLAVARFAMGDVSGAERDLWRFADQAAPAEREDLLLEAYETAHALARDRPDLAPHRAFLDRIAAELHLIP